MRLLDDTTLAEDIDTLRAYSVPDAAIPHILDLLSKAQAACVEWRRPYSKNTDAAVRRFADTMNEAFAAIDAANGRPVRPALPPVEWLKICTRVLEVSDEKS